MFIVSENAIQWHFLCTKRHKNDFVVMKITPAHFLQCADGVSHPINVKLIKSCLILKMLLLPLLFVIKAQILCLAPIAILSFSG